MRVRAKVILILLFVFSISALNAQDEIDEIVTLLKNFKYQELSKGLESYWEKGTKKIQYRWDIVQERELVNYYFEQIIEFNASFIEEGTNAIFDGYQLKIRLLKSKDGRIAYYKIVKMKFVDSLYYPLEIIIKVDSNSTLMELKEDFYNTYTRELELRELFNEEIKYGKNCGFSGDGPDFRKEFENILKTKDIKALSNWLKSATAEIQLYAIEGILRLHKEGMNFDKKDLDLIEVIANKEGTAFFCSGCITKSYQISDIIKRIREEIYTK